MTLTVENLCVRSAGKSVVKDVSLSVSPGEITAILGSNGAGKSELVLAVAGMLKVDSGSVIVNASNLTNFAPDAVRAAGIAAVPEGHRVLTELSVDDNLRAAGTLLPHGLEDTLSYTYERFPELAALKSQRAGTLSGGQQQMVALGHALMCKPLYLLIDEMSLGLAPIVVKRLMDVVVELKTQGTGIVLIEQFTELALGVADNAVVLRNGVSRYAGTAKALQENSTLLDKAYFGVDHKVI